MNTLRKISLIFLSALGTAAGSAYGSTTFDFSYTFGNGAVVTGTLQGDPVGDSVNGYVQNVSGVTLNLNGTPLSGPFFVGQESTTGWAIGGVVSFNESQNNFIFVNGDLNNLWPGTGIYTDWFISSGVDVYGSSFAEIAAYGLGDFDYVDSPMGPSSWSLEAVPEPSTYIGGALTLLPFGGSALRILRRKQLA